jgi:hypothetical protein
LGQPERHLHGAVQPDGGGQFGAGLGAASALGRELPEAEVAVGHERPHPQRLSEGEGLVVVISGLRALRWITPRRNLAEEVQGIRLVTTFLVLAGMRRHALGEGLRLLQAASQHLRLPQEETTERLMDHRFRCSCLFHRPREQRHSVGDAPAQGIRLPHVRSDPWEMCREVCIVTEAQSPFIQGECSGQIALAEGQFTNPATGIYEACGVGNYLGNPQPFFPEGPAFSERPQLGMTLGEVDMGEDSGQDSLTEGLVARVPSRDAAICPRQSIARR